MFRLKLGSIVGSTYSFEKPGPDFGSLGVEGDGQVAIEAGVCEVLLGRLPRVRDGLGVCSTFR